MKSSVIYIRTVLLVALTASLMYILSCTSKVDGFGSFPYVELSEESADSYQIGKEGGTITVKFNTNRTLSASSSESWAHTDCSGSDVTITVDPTDEEAERTATVTISDRNGFTAVSITIKQAPSGNHTFAESVLLSSDDEISSFVSSYNRIDGSLILGYDSNESSSGASAKSAVDNYAVEIDGRFYNFTNSARITNLSPLDSLIHLGGGIYLMLNTSITETQIRKIASLGADSWTLVGNTMITTVDSIKNFGITDLTIRHSPWMDFSTLSDMTELRHLDISSNELKDISFLTGLSLESLVLGSGEENESNTVVDLTPIYTMTTLQNLDISGLPIPQDVIDEIAGNLSGCDITADNMNNEIPAISEYPATVTRTETSIYISTEILSAGHGDILEKGYMLGTEPDISTMTRYTAENEGNTIDLEITGLVPSTVYYFIPFATNSMGSSTMLSENILHTFTLGNGRTGTHPKAELDSDEYNRINFTDTLYVTGSTGEVSYGSIMSTDPEHLTLEEHESRSSYSATFADDYYTYENSLPILTVDDSYRPLNEGVTYYIRTFVTNEFGTSYGEIAKVLTQGQPTNMTTYNWHAEVNLPAYSGADGDTVQMPDGLYAYYYRDDIGGSNSYYYTTVWNNNTFSYSLYEGEQRILLTNYPYDTQGDWYGGDIAGSWDFSDEGCILPHEFFYSIIDINLTEDTTTDIWPGLKSARISSLTLSYYDASGNMYSDLSSMIAEIEVTAAGVAEGMTIYNELEWAYSEEGSLHFSTGNISETGTQTIAENIHVLPYGTTFDLTVSITFTDGEKITLPASYKALQSGNDYNIGINLYDFENENGVSFTIDVLDTVKEEIEF